jgi:hypothetical protein
MTALLVVVSVCAILFFFMLAASLLAALAFWWVPALEGTILALTASDIVWMLRQMPVYPTWWHSHETKRRKKDLVMLAVNSSEKPKYFCGFDPLHRSVFTSERGEGLRLDLIDRFLVEKLIHKLEDEALEVFIVFVETSRPGTRKVLAGSRFLKRGQKWYDLRPPANFPAGRKVSSNPRPADCLLARRSGPISPRLG